VKLDERPLRSIKGLVAPEEARVLGLMASQVRDDHAVVEVGSHRGLSSCWLIAGSRAGNGAHVTCIDPWMGWEMPDAQPDATWADDGAFDRWKRNVASIGGWPWVTPLRSTAVAVAAQWAQPVGLFFHDAGHGYDDVVDDYRAWLPYLVPGAWVAVHDYYGNSSDGNGGWQRDGSIQEAVVDAILPSGRWTDVRIVGTADGPVLPNLWRGRRWPK